MARPKQHSTEPSAYSRIENAFWQLLEEMPFDKITVSSLSKRANVNHNMIYYYFDNIQDMAQKLFDANLTPDIPTAILSTLFTQKPCFSAITHSEENMRHIRRAHLFARSDSAYLNHIIKEKIQSIWLDAMGVQRHQLTPEDLIDLDFIFNGLISVIGSNAFDEHYDAIITLYQRPLGLAIKDTLLRFASRAQ